MRQLARRASLVVVLLLASVGTASAELRVGAVGEGAGRSRVECRGHLARPEGVREGTHRDDQVRQNEPHDGCPLLLPPRHRRPARAEDEVTTDTRLWPSWLRVERLLRTATFAFLTTTTPAWPHSGGLDSYGCHHDRKRGGYHCHRGESAGRSFVSKNEMLQQLPGPAAPRATPLRLATVLLALLVLTGCSVSANPYAVHPDTITTLRSHTGKSVKLTTFTSDKPGKSRSCAVARP
jgi:hypothetical protein